MELVESIKRKPHYLRAKPLQVFNGVIYGGNQRYDALLFLGYKEVPAEWVQQLKDFTPEELKEIMLLDNIHIGEFDFKLLGGDFWKDTDLPSLGLFIPEGFNFDVEPPPADKPPKEKKGDDDLTATKPKDKESLTLFFPRDEHEQILEQLEDIRVSRGLADFSEAFVFLLDFYSTHG